MGEDGISRSEIPLGRYLAMVRREAGMTQAELAQKLTFSTAGVSRIESGESSPTDDEVVAMLKAIGGQKAAELEEYLGQDWDELERPPFDHLNQPALWQANLALRKLRRLREDPELKGVFLRQVDFYEKELRRLTDFLRPRSHQIAFIGSIGVGKSTAICKLAGLLKPGEKKLDDQIVLETGAGGITLCEVHLSKGPKHGIRIVPRTDDSIRKDVEDFCDYLIKVTQPEASVEGANEDDDDNDEGDPLGISKEVARAIRNMAGLGETRRKQEDGRRVRIDPAKDLAKQYPTKQELAIQVLTRMNLLRRNERDAWYPEDATHPPEHWLQQIFASVNNCRHPEFTLPQTIEVVVPNDVLDSNELPVRIVDTKGIDQTAERRDLECHFDDPRTLVVLCSRFNDSPEVAVQTLLHRAKENGVRDVDKKTVLLVLPRFDEALAVKYDDGTKVEDEIEGYDLKRDQIEMRLGQKGLGRVPVEFLNARDEEPEPLRDRLVKRIGEYRQHYCEQISLTSDAVDRLEENRGEEQIRLVFEEVNRHVGTWIEKNRELELADLQIKTPLISAIDATRYASTVRAAVRRYGDWYNLDYYHHLAVGARRIAVSEIGKKIENFKTIVANLIDNGDLAPAKEFLLRVLDSVDATVDEAYRRLQVSGGEAFRRDMEQDYSFWARCEDRWGGGKGYRTAISSMTDQQLDTSYESDYELVRGLVIEEWGKLTTMLEDMLREKDNGAPVA